MASSLLSSLITQPSPSIFVKIQRSRSLKQLRCFPNKSHFAHSSSSPLSHPPPSPRFSAAASLCTYRFFSQSPSLRHFAARAVAVAASEAPQSDGAGASLCAYRSFSSHFAHSLLIQSNQLEVGKMVMNVNWSKPWTSGFLPPAQNAKGGVEVGNQLDATRYEIPDLNSPIGNCMPLAYIRMGTLVHCIECNPGQGAKLVRAAGTFAKVMKVQAPQCLVQLPSGVEKLIDYRCRATIGVVSNSSHSTRKLRKAGRSRWLGRRPVVRGVAMNPVDHPHGGGEGRTKGGRPSVSPWGKPTKAGFRTGVKKHKK